MKRVLITGHLGFIGRHITRALEDAGYEPHGVDIARPSGLILPGDDARDFFRRNDRHYDVVVHAAAVVGGRAVIEGNPLALAVNLELDAALFQWAARTKPGRVVYLSSSAVYPVALQHGDVDGWPLERLRMLDPRHLREDDVDLKAPELPDQLYGWCKLTGERLAALARAEGIPVTVVRPFSGYGEDQSEDYPFAAMAARASRRDDPFEIWGTGEQVRDWIHVDDICAAILAMVREGIDGPVNLGTGRAVPMRQMAGMFAAAAGYEPEFKTLPEKPAGVAYRVADVTRLSEFYAPAVSLEEGVERALGAVRI